MMPWYEDDLGRKPQVMFPKKSMGRLKRMRRQGKSAKYKEGQNGWGTWRRGKLLSSVPCMKPMKVHNLLSEKADVLRVGWWCFGMENRAGEARHRRGQRKPFRAHRLEWGLLLKRAVHKAITTKKGFLGSHIGPITRAWHCSREKPNGICMIRQVYPGCL